MSNDLVRIPQAGTLRLDQVLGGRPLARKWVAPFALFRSEQVLAHEVWPRIGRPRQQGQAGGIGSVAYEAIAGNCSEKNSTPGRSLQL